MGIVQPQPPAIAFDSGGFLAAFPTFDQVPPAQLAIYYDMAGGWCANSTTNPMFVTGMLQYALWLLTAHITTLMAPRNAQGQPAGPGGAPASPIVGRISNASEGSVSVTTENNYAAGTPQWYQQTTFGSMYWSMTAGARTFRYSAKPTIVVNGMFAGRPVGRV